MTTQTHKWLPNKSTEEMLYAFFEVAGEYCIPAFTQPKVIEAFRAYWQAAPEVEQEPVGEIYEQQADGSNRAEMVIELPVGTKLYTHPQPTREAFTVTRHEVREAMMYCEINHCDDPDAYTFDILKRLGIEVE
jgi:hypothetical protein